MLMTPELQAKMAEWRAASIAGTITTEQLREAVATMRAARGAAPQATSGTRARKSAAAAKPNGDDLLKELEGLE